MDFLSLGVLGSFVFGTAINGFWVLDLKVFVTRFFGSKGF